MINRNLQIISLQFTYLVVIDFLYPTSPLTTTDLITWLSYNKITLKKKQAVCQSLINNMLSKWSIFYNTFKHPLISDGSVTVAGL